MQASNQLKALAMSVLLVVSATAAVAAIGTTTAQQSGNTPTATVAFSNQTTAGSTVVVDSVNVSDGGFVAIHDSSLLEGNVVGSVIGVSEYLEPGMHDNVTITLFDVPGATFDQTELTTNQTLIAMPHLDTNANGTYDFVSTDGAADGAYVADGSAVTDSATVTLAEENQDESFAVTGLSAPEVAETGGPVTVEATVSNPNDVNATQMVVYRFDGEVVAREMVSLEAGASTTLSFSVDGGAVETGQHFHGVYTRTDGISAPIQLVEEIQSFTVSDLSAPETIVNGETFTVTATVGNPNDFAIDQGIEYRFGGPLVAVENVSLDAGESTTVEFEIATDNVEPGAYVHSVFSRDLGQSALITVTNEAGETPTATPEPGTATPIPAPGTDTPTSQPGTGTPTAEPGTVTPTPAPGTGTPTAEPGTDPTPAPGTGTPTAEPGTDPTPAPGTAMTDGGEA